MQTKQAWTGFADAEVLTRVTVRLIEPEERKKWNALVEDRHYLDSRLVGPTLRYVAEVDGRAARTSVVADCSEYALCAAA